MERDRDMQWSCAPEITSMYPHSQWPSVFPRQRFQQKKGKWPSWVILVCRHLSAAVKEGQQSQYYSTETCGIMAVLQPFIISLCHSQTGASHMITQSATAPLLTWSLVNQFVQVLNAVFKHIFNNEKLSVLKERSYVFESHSFLSNSFRFCVTWFVLAVAHYQKYLSVWALRHAQPYMWNLIMGMGISCPFPWNIVG